MNIATRLLRTALAATVALQPLAAAAADAEFYFRLSPGVFGLNTPGATPASEAMLPLRTSVNGSPTVGRDVFYDGDSGSDAKGYQAKAGDRIEIVFATPVSASRTLFSVRSAPSSPVSVTATYEKEDGGTSDPVVETIADGGSHSISYGSSAVSSKFTFVVDGNLDVTDVRVGGAPANPRPTVVGTTGSTVANTSQLPVDPTKKARIRIASASKIYDGDEPTVELVGGTLPKDAYFDGGELVLPERVSPVAGPWDFTVVATDGVGFASEPQTRRLASFDPASGEVLTIRFDTPFVATRAVVKIRSGDANVTSTWLDQSDVPSAPLEAALDTPGEHSIAYPIDENGRGVVSKVFRFAFDSDIELDDIYIDGYPLEDVVFDEPDDVAVSSPAKILPSIASSAGIVAADGRLSRIAAVTDSSPSTAIQVAGTNASVVLDFAKVVKTVGATLSATSATSTAFRIDAFDGETWTEVATGGDGTSFSGEAAFPAPVYAAKYRLTFTGIAPGQFADLSTFRIGTTPMPMPEMAYEEGANVGLIDGKAKSVSLSAASVWPYENVRQTFTWLKKSGDLPPGVSITDKGVIQLPADRFDMPSWAFVAEALDNYGQSVLKALVIDESPEDAPSSLKKLPEIAAGGLVFANDGDLQKVAALTDEDPATAVSLAGSGQTLEADFKEPVKVSSVTMDFAAGASSGDWQIERFRAGAWQVLKSGPAGTFSGTVDLDEPAVAQSFRLKFTGSTSGSIATLRFGSSPMPLPDFSKPANDVIASLNGTPQTAAVPGIHAQTWPYDNVPGTLTYALTDGELPGTATLAADGRIALSDVTDGRTSWDFTTEVSNPYGMSASRAFRIVSDGTDGPDAFAKLPTSVVGAPVSATDPDLQLVAAVTDEDQQTVAVLGPTNDTIDLDFGRAVKVKDVTLEASSATAVTYDLIAIVAGQPTSLSSTPVANIGGTLPLATPVVAQKFRLKVSGISGEVRVSTLRFGSAPMPKPAFALAENAVAGTLKGVPISVSVAASHAWPYDNVPGTLTHKLSTGTLPGGALVAANGSIPLDGKEHGQTEWTFAVEASNPYGLSAVRTVKLDSDQPLETCQDGYVGTPPDCVKLDDPKVCPTGFMGTPPDCTKLDDPDKCPAGYTGTPPSCTKVPETCLAGQTGTPPNCQPAPTCPAGQTGTPPNCQTTPPPPKTCAEDPTQPSCQIVPPKTCAEDNTQTACQVVPPPESVPDPETVKPVETVTDKPKPDEPLKPDEFQNPDGVYLVAEGETITISFPDYVRAAESYVSVVEGTASVIPTYKLADDSWVGPSLTTAQDLTAGENRISYGSRIVSKSFRFKFTKAAKISSIRIGVQTLRIRPKMLANNTPIAYADTAAGSRVKIVSFDGDTDPDATPNIFIIPVSGGLPAGTTFDGGDLVFPQTVDLSGGPWIFQVIGFVNGSESTPHRYFVNAAAPSSVDNLPGASGTVVGDGSGGLTPVGAVSDEDPATGLALTAENPMVTLTFDRYVTSDHADISVDFGTVQKTFVVEIYEDAGTRYVDGQSVPVGGAWREVYRDTQSTYTGRADFSPVIAKQVRLRVVE